MSNEGVDKCTLDTPGEPHRPPGVRHVLGGERHMPSPANDDFDGMIIARVTITRVMSDDDIIDHVIAASADGDEFGLAEALGMMRLAEDTLIRSRMPTAEDDD